MIKLIKFAPFAFFCSVVFGANEQSVSTSQEITSSAPKAETASMDLCPTYDKLVKEGLFWHAPSGWVSYSESFDTHIVKFSRAEWVGVNVGKIICIYKGNKKLSFPIALEQKHNKITPAPENFRWSKDLGGHKECVSDAVTDCPFLFEKPKDEGDIYQQLDFFKGKTHDDE